MARWRLSTRSGLKPGLTAVSVAKVRASSTLPVRSGSASAIWPITRRLRARACRTPPAVDRVASRVADVKSDRQACDAGSSAATRPVRVSTTIDTASTMPLISMFSTRGSVGGASGMNHAIADAANTTPSNPPTASSGTISATDCSATRAAGRAEREPHRQLAAARRRPRRQQRRQVQRRHEQQAQHGAEHDVERRTHVRRAGPRASGPRPRRSGVVTAFAPRGARQSCSSRSARSSR